MGILNRIFGGRRAVRSEPSPAASPASRPAPDPPEPAPDLIREITPPELKRRIDLGEAVVVVDVRRATEYEAGHIPGARHLSLEELVARREELPRDAELVIQCWHGNTSLDVAGFLIENGWDRERVESLSGGFAGWVEAHGTGSLRTD